MWGGGPYSASGLPPFAPREHHSCHASFSFSCSPIFSSAAEVHLSSVSFSHLSSMQPKSREKSEKLFACNVCDHRFAMADNMRSHKQAVHGEKVFKCPQPGCEYSPSRKIHLVNHLKGFHGTAGSFACDHPGCSFRTAWPGSISNHKRQVHSDERPFACDYTGCAYRAKMMGNLTQHKNSVHLNIRNERCHVCEKEFHGKPGLRLHMTTHEGDGHEMAKCEDCSVNLRSKSSVTNVSP